jgi:hypothetical protein
MKVEVVTECPTQSVEHAATVVRGHVMKVFRACLSPGPCNCFDARFLSVLADLVRDGVVSITSKHRNGTSLCSTKSYLVLRDTSMQLKQSCLPPSAVP